MPGGERTVEPNRKDVFRRIEAALDAAERANKGAPIELHLFVNYKPNGKKWLMPSK